MNVISFTGNLGQDCEQRSLADGTSIVSMSVACKAGFGDKATTTWLRCTMFGKRGEAVSQYLKKGVLVGVTGDFSAREYTDKEGAKRQSLEVRVNDLTLLGGRKDDAPIRTAKPASKPSAGFDDMDDDIPF